MGHSAINLLLLTGLHTQKKSAVHNASHFHLTKITNTNARAGFCSSVVNFLIILSALGVLGSFITSVVS